jgi:outer membrane biosynthesis protein TonB
MEKHAMTDPATSAPNATAGAHRPGVNPGFGKFLAGLVLGLVVGLPAGAVLPAMLGMNGAAFGGAEAPPAGEGHAKPRPKGPVVLPPEQPESQRPVPKAPAGETPAPAAEPTKPAEQPPTPATAPIPAPEQPAPSKQPTPPQG